MICVTGSYNDTQSTTNSNKIQSQTKVIYKTKTSIILLSFFRDKIVTAIFILTI